MAYRFPVMQVTTERLLDELPLKLNGEFTSFIKNFGTASFTLNTMDPACPPNWEQIIDTNYGIILIVDDDDDIRWSGYVSEYVINSDGTVTIQCTSLEGLAAKVNLPDMKIIGADQSAIFSAFVDVLNATGLNLVKRITATGTQAAVIIKESDNKSVLAAMQEQSSGIVSYEFIFEAEWTDATHTAIRKVVTMEQTLGVSAAETQHYFELIPDEPGEGNNGNIVDFSVQKSTAKGSDATHVWATGDGTGDLQIRSQVVVNTDRINAGYPQVDFVQNYPGTRRATDIQQAAASLAKNLFKGSKALTLKVADSEGTRIKDVKRGDCVYMDISTSSYKVAKVMRVVSTSQAAEHQFAPVMAEIGIDPIFVPRPDDPDTLGRILNGINDGIAISTSAYSPVATGFESFNADGSSFKLDTTAGTFGAYDANGNMLGGIDSSGSGVGANNPTPVSSSFYRKDTSGQAIGVGVDSSGTSLSPLVSNSQNLMFWNGGDTVAQMGCGTDPFINRGDFIALGSGTTTANSGNGRARLMQFYANGDHYVGSVSRQSRQDNTGEFTEMWDGKHIQIGRQVEGQKNDAGVPIEGDYKTLDLNIYSENMVLHSGLDLSLFPGQNYKVKLGAASFVDGMTVDRGFTSLPGSPFNVNGDGRFTGSVYASTVSGQTKSFLQVNPEDHTKKIEYRSTESPMNMIEDKGRVVLGEDGTAAVSLREEFLAIMVPDSLDVFPAQRGSRVKQAPSYDVTADGFVLYGDPGATLSWHAMAERQSLNINGVNVIAFDVITDNDLPPHFQPDYEAPETQ